MTTHHDARYTARYEGDAEPGNPIDLGEFAVLNDLEPEDLNAIGALGVGEEWTFGGGAAVAIIVRRVW